MERQPSYETRNEVLSRVIWAGSIHALQLEGMFDPKRMPDVTTSLKAVEVVDAYKNYLTLCGEMMELITPEEKPGKRKHATP